MGEHKMSFLRIGLAVLLVTEVYGASLEGKGRFSKKHEDLLSKLENYQYIRPYRSSADGSFLSYDLNTDLEEEHLEYKRVKKAHNSQRGRRSLDDGQAGDEYSEEEEVEGGDSSTLFHFAVEGMSGEQLVLSVEKNRELFSPTFVVNKFTEDGSLFKEKPNTNCFYLGHVIQSPNSSVAISNCAGLSGWISTGDEEYIIEPVEPEHSPVISNFTYDGTHIIYRTSDHRSLRDPGIAIPENLLDRYTLFNDTLSPDWDPAQNGEGGQRTKRSSDRPHTIDSPHYVETMVAADWSMQRFHGSGITLYLTTMMNIVNKAYAHESLGVNIKFVIARIILLNKEQSKNLVVEGNAASSLTNICRWAASITTPQDSLPEHHDFAAFVTKTSFGPAGFAPVTGMCAITRSCSLNRDEGLLTSFVMAHEAGHVLGLEHDGDQNDCELEDGAIMAPVVTATYNKYFWSRCSKRELLRHLPDLTCLWDTPFNETDEIPFPGIRYTMNDQCRFDFGPGTITCNGQYNIDPCRNLWCLQPNSIPARTCRSKKGPPLDGSSCGPGRWCIQGRCRDIENRQDGGWSDWEPWAACTYNCGTGVRTRVRRCDNPPPVNGGQYCEGESVQYKLCNTHTCKKNKDRRAIQCRDNLGNWVYHGETHTWLPFQSRNRTQQCKLTCMSESTKDVVVSTYNVTDGTPCNYEDPDSICIQGECVNIGCDRELGSSLRADNCGVCNDSTIACRAVQAAKKKMPKQAKQYKRDGIIPLKDQKYIKMVKIPAGVTNLKIEEVKESPYFIALKDTTSGRYILNGNRKQSRAHDFIDSGARFIYRPDGPETLVTAGPLPYPLQLRVYVTGQIALVHVRWSYFERQQQVRAAPPTDEFVASDEGAPPLSRPVTEEVGEVPEYPDTPAGFVWEAKGWTNCTEACGGGISYYHYQCRRASDDAIVHPRRCDQSGYDERAISRPCNEQECLPDKPAPVYEWQTSDWGACSRTCGLAGTKTRTITCHEFRYNDDGTLFEPETEVTDGFCHSADRPAEVTECQGRLCSAEWSIGRWSPCSVTCGSGKQTRTVVCQKPEGREAEFKCYLKPDTKRGCSRDPCPVTEDCVPSATPVCKPKNYKQFCGVAGYEDFCCATCQQQKAKLAKTKKKKNRGRTGRDRAETNDPMAQFLMASIPVIATTTEAPENV